MAALSWIAGLEPLHDAVPMAIVSDLTGSSPDSNALCAEAFALRAQAEMEAAELLDDARTQAETLREAAWQEGYHAGKLEAVAVVEAEACTARAEYQSALRAEMDCLIEQITEARCELWQRQEAEMVALTLDIAKQVIKTEVAQNPEVVRQVIGNALRRINDKENVRIRVCPADAAAVKEMREELIEMMDGLRHLEILDDRRVGQGGCVIETNAGTIDAKIETQIAEVARALGVSVDD